MIYHMLRTNQNYVLKFFAIVNIRHDSQDLPLPRKW